MKKATALFSCLFVLEMSIQTGKRRNMNQKRRDLMATKTWALENMKAEYGESFKPENVNLPELQRRTGISRKRLRKLKADGFQARENKLKGTNNCRRNPRGIT